MDEQVPQSIKKPSYKDVKTLKSVVAILKHPTLAAAYKELHPHGNSRVSNGQRILTPEVFDEIKKLLQMESLISANKDILEKVLFMVVARWMKKEEKTTDMISAVKELTKLVPEFKDRLQVEDISKADEKELDRKLREFGYDPNRLAQPFVQN